MKEKEKILKDYLEFKKISINHKEGMYNHKHFISMFMNSNKKFLKLFNEKDLINFLNSISKKYSIGTLNIIKHILKSFIVWYCRKDLRKYPHIDKICKRQKKERTYSSEQMLSKEDIEKLVQEEPEVRWKAFFLLYFYGGFRPGEVCNLKWEQISFDSSGAYIRIYVEKNNKSFEKFVPDNVSFYLKKLQDNGSEFVFPTKRKWKNTTKKDKEKVSVGDKPQTRSGVYQHLIPLAKRVLNKHINPYILRHSIATILYNKEGLKDDDTAQQMGHSVSMKETYSHLSKDKIRERMKKIWIQGEDFPPEKKDEIALMKKQIQQLQDFIIEGKPIPLKELVS